MEMSSLQRNYSLWELWITVVLRWFCKLFYIKYSEFILLENNLRFTIATTFCFCF